MRKLTMESTIKNGKNSEISVSELVSIKGKIFSLIKEGYEFDDEVLAAAHISKHIRDEKVYCRIGNLHMTNNSHLPKDTATTKQIISELNTINNLPSNNYNDEASSYCDNNDNTEEEFNDYGDND